MNKKNNLKSIVLRTHPDFIDKTGWSNQLLNALTLKGYQCELQDSSVSIDSIACNYKCIAGFASSSLRDLRVACEKVIIIGFKSVSKYYFDDPKFVFGESYGINWIEEDGSFNHSIYKKNKNFVNNRIDISEAIKRIKRKNYHNMKN